ncbi:MAG: hypothetical protein RLP15_11225 [Cryomorphaceae bacterium]
MKTIITSATAVLLLLASCQKPEEINSHYASSDCTTEKCECLPGYAGDYCDVPLFPTSVMIKRIEINSFPALNNGESWDEYIGAPDVYFKITHMHDLVYESDVVFQDAEADECLKFKSLQIDLSDVIGEYRLRLLDQDVDEKTFEIIEDIYFNPHVKDNGFPDTLQLREGETAATLYLSYTF